MTIAHLDQLADRYGLFLCVECGKCSAVCPMGDLYDDYRYDISPRGIINRGLVAADFEQDDHLWSCLTCDMCTDLCPAGVQIRDYVMAVREWLIAGGHDEHAAKCSGCGTYIGPRRTDEHLRRTLGEGSGEDLLALCAPCRRREMGRKMSTLVPTRRCQTRLRR